MSEDYLPDSPVLSRAYCPICEPDADPSREALDVRYCNAHEPDRTGADDGIVVAQAYLSGSAEAGGRDNENMCELLHRGIWPSGEHKEESKEVPPPCDYC